MILAKRNTARSNRDYVMNKDYGSLQSSDLVSNRLHKITEDTVSTYLSAVQDESALLSDSNGATIAPPMAIAALSLRGVIEDLNIPGGTLHVGQETSNINLVSIGTELTCKANVLTNTVRGDWRFLTVTLKVTTSDKTPVLSGKSTIMLPKA